MSHDTGFFRPLEARGRRLGDGRVPAVCVPLVADGEADLLAELAAVLPSGPDVIEWRVDHYLAARPPAAADPSATQAAVLGLLSRLRGIAGDVPLIFTLRSAAEGGRQTGFDAQGAGNLLAAVADTGIADYIDLELAAPSGVRARVFAAARRSGARVIVSAHDFTATPSADEIFDTLAAAAAAGADVAKIAVMPQSVDDVLALLSATTRAHRELDLPLITMAMGPLGVATRVFGGLFGSALSFAAGRQASAPCQLPVAELQAALELVRSRSLPR
jgi:3-dehydroquinate dehydratase-1